MSDPFSLNLSFDLAKDDSPYFRANLQRIEDEVEKLSIWLENLCKSLKAFTEEINRYNDCSNQLASRVMPHVGSELIDPDLSVNTLRTFADALQCVYSFKAKMVDDLQEYLLVSLQQFLKEDVKEFREQRKNYERICDRYDNAVNRYASLSKLKDASALREDAFQLFDIRKTYIKTSMEYTSKALKFKTTLDRLILDQFTDAMDSIMDFYQNAAEIYKGLKPRIDQLKTLLKTRRVDLDKQMELLLQHRNNLEEDAVEMFRPSSALPIASNVIKPTVSSSTPIEKEGYLFKKTVPKAPIAVPAWYRRWVYIKDGRIGIRSLFPKHRGMIASSIPFSLLLCEVKLDDKQDRRYCFEVISSKRTMTFQAESEEELVSWMSVFEAAKQYAIQNKLRDSENEQLTSNEPKIFSEDEEWDQLSTHPLTRQTFSEFKRLNQLDKLVIQYPDFMMERKNDELHSIIKQLAPEEVLLESLPASLQKDILIQGRVYLTPNYFCFYSNILGLITTVILEFKQIKKIQRKVYHGLNMISIQSQNSEHLLKTPYKDDVKTFGALNTILWNVQSEHPMSVQELFDTIYQSYRHFNLVEEQPQSVRQRQRPVSDAALQPVSSKLSDQAKKVEKKVITSAATTTTSANVKNKKEEPWPADVPLPTAEVQCGCQDHYEKEEFTAVYNISAKKLYDLLFNNESDLFQQVHQKRGDWDFQKTDWNAAEQPARELKWMFHVNNSMVKVKETDCIENQIILKQDWHLCYIVDTNSRTVNVPYGDAFQTQARFCITFLSKESCRLRLTCGLKWFKQPLVKGIIRGAAMKGLCEYLQDLIQVLQQKLGEVEGVDVHSATPLPSPAVRNEQNQSVIKRLLSVNRVIQPIVGSSSSGSNNSQDDYTYYIVWLVNFLLVGYLIISWLLTPSPNQLTKWTVNDVIRNPLIMSQLEGITLSDLNEQLYNHTALEHVPRLQRKSFSQFLKQSQKYVWHQKDLLTRNKDLLQLQKQTQKLRLEYMQSIHKVNHLELRLLEMLFVNWMKDQLIWCRSSLKSIRKEEYEKLEKACLFLDLELQQFLLHSTTTTASTINE